MILNKEEALVFLHDTVKPSLGCTEPACAALCAAAAAEKLHGNIQSISLTVNPGLYKNGMSVAIPGFDRVGMDYAAALGALIGTTDGELQIFEEITPEIAERAKILVASGNVRVTADYEQKGIYARCEVTSDGETAQAVIRNTHTNLVQVSYNGAICFQKEQQFGNSGKDSADALKKMTIAEISRLVDSMTISELDWLVAGAAVNGAVAVYGVQHPSTVGIAAALHLDFCGSEADEMMRSVGAAIESRLDGCPCSVTSSAGAGSKGLALTIPLSIAAEHSKASREQLARALAFGHLVNSYINAVIGKLSAVCTCAAAASTAAAAAQMAVRNSVLRESDGICAATPEQCIANIAQIANVGMENVDLEILRIMLAKRR